MIYLESDGAQVVSVIDDDILGICVAADAILFSTLNNGINEVLITGFACN